MSLSTRDQVAPRRRNRVYGAHEPPGARLSGLSLVSNATAVSTSSNGSASTVTPDSYLKSKQPSEKKKRSRRRSDVNEGKLEKPMPDTSIVAHNVDVFEFLVEESRREKVQLEKVQLREALPEEIQPKEVQFEKVQPRETQLRETQPREVQPREVQPREVQPEEVQPRETQPRETQPRETQSRETQSREVQPEEVQPKEAQPKEVQPKEIQPKEVQLREAKSREARPRQVQSREAQPREVQLKVIQPERVPPKKIQPEKIQPEMEMTSSLSFLQPKQEIQPDSEESDIEGYYRSQRSDSGISMGSSTGDIIMDTPAKHPLSPLIEEAGDFPHYAPSVIDPFYQHEHQQMWVPFGGPTYVREPMPLSPATMRTYPYPQEYAYRGTPDPPSTRESSVTCLDSAPLVFRDRAHKKTQHPLIFRSFAKLNEKVLLQMQSNITDLEHELTILDAKTVSADARYKKGDHTVSRHFSKDQSQRADLYQELHTNLEQYYQSLASFHQISQLTSPSGLSDTVAFKSWLRHQILPASKVASLLGDGSDMVKFGSPTKESSDQTLRVIAYSVFANIFLPLLLFKLTGRVLSRLIILSVTTTVATLMMERHRANSKLDLGDLHWHCIIGSAGVSLFAAILF